MKEIRRRIGLRAAIAPLATVSYSEGMRCPSCRSSAWTIRNVTAECHFCGYALMLPAAVVGGGKFTVRAG